MNNKWLLTFTLQNHFFCRQARFLWLGVIDHSVGKFRRILCTFIIKLNALSSKQINFTPLYEISLLLAVNHKLYLSIIYQHLTNIFLFCRLEPWHQRKGKSTHLLLRLTILVRRKYYLLFYIFKTLRHPLTPIKY